MSVHLSCVSRTEVLMPRTLPGPDDRRRHLAEELRRIRSLAGMSGRVLADKLEISQSKVSRIESGDSVPSLPEVRAWADAVHASEDTWQLLSALTETTHTTVSRWRAKLGDRPHLQDDVEAKERAATRIRTFQPSVVPGLLQTADYARRVFSMFQEPPYGPGQLAQAVAARGERQLLLHDPERSFDFLITEAALRWRPGSPASLAAQIDRIASLSTLDNVTVGVLPLAGRATVPHSHAFTIYEPADDENDVSVNVEMIHATLDVFRESDVSAFQRRWAALGRSALHGDEARSLLQRLVAETRALDDRPG
jgi:transcriptional regulator with XRE-family HTH domain